MIRKLVVICAICCSIVAWADQVAIGQWTLDIDSSTGTTDITYAGKTLIRHNRAAFYIGSTLYDQAQMTCRTITQQNISDSFGSGVEVCVVSEKNSVRALHYYYLYQNKPYLLTKLVLVSSNSISSNWMAPVYATEGVSFLPSSNNYNLFVPWDNDEWVRYNSVAFGGELTSNEVTALYNNATNEAMIIGSIEHTVWKTGVKANTKSSGQITQLQAFAGLSNSWTRDILPHGAISGTSISSPTMIIGWFSDWRDGMEQFADLNAIVAPKLQWNGGKPFVWNSWGVLQTSISYDNATQNAEWIANNLPEYQNDSTMYMDLDSYWTNLTTTRLKQFAKLCHDRGQKAGIYWTPFVDWSNTPERQVEGAMQYTYSDIWLRANGQPIKRTQASACDPTHPGTRARMKQYMNYFRSWGFDFVKLDFMDHGALQADSYYDSTITTAMQAYASGMTYLDSLAGDMFLNLSIAPLFPAQFAHGRRIACDAYSSLDNSEYTLNSTTFGWWLDHVYSYNDADNIVLKGQTEGVNKVRIISGVITGLMCIGDDFSDNGDATAKTRAQTLLNKKHMMQCARQTKAFRPLDPPTGTGAASTYYTTVQDTLYLAVINWEAHNTTFTFDFNHLGLNQATDYAIMDLWSGVTNTLQPNQKVTIPKANGFIFKICPRIPEGVENTSAYTANTRKIVQDGQIFIQRNNLSFTILGQPVQ